MSDPIDIVERLREALTECAEAADLPAGNIHEGIERLRAQRDAHEEACECAIRAAPIILARLDAQAAEITRLRAELAEAQKLARDQFDLRAEQRDGRDELRAALSAAQGAQPVAWDVHERRIYGAPGETRHRVLWVSDYRREDGTTPDLDDLLHAARERGCDPGARTISVRPMIYADAAPAASGASPPVAVPTDGLHTAARLACEATADQLPMALDALRDHLAADTQPQGREA